MTTECADTPIEYPPVAPVLADLISECKRLSGRNELTDPQWITHINDAQKHLDRLIERTQQRAQNFYNVPEGTVGITFSSRCRVIDQVWVVDPDVPDCPRLYLDHLHRGEMHDYWITGNARADYPCFYTEAVLRHYPGNVRIGDMESILAYDETVLLAGYCNGIVIWPAVSRPISVEVLGNFHDEILTADWPYSWWLINNPDLLKKATMRELEVFMRNSQGVADYDHAIAAALASVDFDDAEQEAVHITRFYG